MTIATIQDKELGSSVRAKMNAAISAANSLVSNAAPRRSFNPMQFGYTDSTYAADPVAALNAVLAAIANEGSGILELPPVPVTLRADGPAVIFPTGGHAYQVRGKGEASKISIVPGTEADNSRFSVWGCGIQGGAKAAGLRKQTMNIGTGLTLTCTWDGSNQLVSAVPVDAGTGYYADEPVAGGGWYGTGVLVTLAGGDPTGGLEINRAQVMVTAVSTHRGPVTAVRVVRPGLYTTLPANPVAQLSSQGMNIADTYFDDADLIDLIIMSGVVMDGGEGPASYSATPVASYEHQIRGFEASCVRKVFTTECTFRNFLNSGLMHNYVGQAAAIGNYFENIGFRKFAGQPANAIDFIGLGKVNFKEHGLSVAAFNTIRCIHDVGIQTAAVDLLVSGNAVLGCGSLAFEHQRHSYATLDKDIPGNVTLDDNKMNGDMTPWGLAAPTDQDAVVLEGGNDKRSILTRNYISNSVRRGVAAYSPEGGILIMGDNTLDKLSTGNNSSSPPLSVQVENFDYDGGEIKNCGSIPVRLWGSTLKNVRAGRPMSIKNSGGPTQNTVVVSPSSVPESLDLAFNVDGGVGIPFDIGSHQGPTTVIGKTVIRGVVKNCPVSSVVTIRDRAAGPLAFDIDEIDVTDLQVINSPLATSIVSVTGVDISFPLVNLKAKQARLLATNLTGAQIVGDAPFMPLVKASLSLDFGSKLYFAAATPVAIAAAAAVADITTLIANYDAADFVNAEGITLTDTTHAAGSGIIGLSATALAAVQMSADNTIIVQTAPYFGKSTSSNNVIHLRKDASNRVDVSFSAASNVWSIALGYRVGGTTITVTLPMIDPKLPHTIVASWSATALTLSVDGKQATMTHALGLISGLTTFDLGWDRSNSGRALNGIMRGLHVIPSSVSKTKQRALSMMAP